MNNKMKLVPGVLALAFAGGAQAGAFQLLEQNTSGLGNAYAGSAAVAEDASTVFFNPAGLSYLPQNKQVVVSVAAVSPTASLNNSSSRSGGGIVSVAPPTQRDFSYSGFGGDLGSLAAVPSAYFSLPVNEKLTFGFGVNAPFGLKTEYDDNWIGRFQGIKSEVKTINLNPSIAFKVNDAVSLGFGLDYQRIEATLTKAVNFNAIIAGLPVGLGGGLAYASGAGLVEGRQSLTGDDSAWGYNLGMIIKLSDAARLGLAYRSGISHTLHGTQTVTKPVTGTAADIAINANPNTQNQAVSVALKTPDTFTASLFYQATPQWDLLADLSYIGWSSISEIRVRFSAAGSTDDVTNWKLKDTFRLALGANYKYRDDLKLRLGMAFDQTPVPDAYRTVRLPDGNRTWLSLGAQYKLNKQSAVDLGATYIYIKDVTINNNGEIPVSALGYARGLTSGTYSGNIKILGAQYTLNF